MTCRDHRFATSVLILGLLAAVPQVAIAQRARITDLSDVAFGAISNLSADVSLARSLCAYSTNGNYRVSATGSGPASTFALSSGSALLAYEVQWASSANQTTGIPLSAGVPLTGLASAATHQACNAGPASSASLIVILRASQLGAAQAGTYSGALTLMISPE